MGEGRDLLRRDGGLTARPAMEPLRIGVAARLLYPAPSRAFLPTKSVESLEQSVANWVMSGEVLAFMIPEMSLATPHAPQAIKAKHYVDAPDGLLLQGGADMSPQSYRETPINPLWAGDQARDPTRTAPFPQSR